MQQQIICMAVAVGAYNFFLFCYLILDQQHLLLQMQFLLFTLFGSSFLYLVVTDTVTEQMDNRNGPKSLCHGFRPRRGGYVARVQHSHLPLFLHNLFLFPLYSSHIYFCALSPALFYYFSQFQLERGGAAAAAHFIPIFPFWSRYFCTFFPFGFAVFIFFYNFSFCSSFLFCFVNRSLL